MIQKNFNILVIGIAIFFVALAVIALIEEYILWEYTKGLFLFALSFLIPISLAWSLFRFYKQRKLRALKPLLIPVFVIVLVVGFHIWDDIPCKDICDIRVKKLILPSEKQEFVDSETGAKVVRLTTDPSNDNFDYYEPSHWSPDDKKLKFVSDRFREKYNDPVLHMIGTIDIENGEITIYKTKYSVRWSEWSRDGRYIYGTALFKDRKLEPYFIAIDTEKNSGRVLRLQHKIKDLPEGFDEKAGAVKDPKEAENNWLIRGEYRIPYEALFFHLNPSGTLGIFEMYGAVGVIDLKKWKTWIVGFSENHMSFFNDSWAALGWSAAGGFSKNSKIVNVYTLEEKALEENFSCNHGNIFHENGELSKVICPGRIPDTLEGKYMLYIYDFQNKTIEILNRESEPECCAEASSISYDGQRIAGGSHGGAVVYDLKTKKGVFPISGKFFDKYIGLYGATGANFNGQPMISHDGKKIAFVSGVYESKEKFRETAEFEIPCAKFKELKMWAEMEQRTVEEKQKVAEKLNRPESIELERKCEDLAKYTADIFVVYTKDELFR